MSMPNDTFDFDSYVKSKYNEQASWPSNASLDELQKTVTELESQVYPLTKQQTSTLEMWSAAVARIQEKPFVKSYQTNYAPSQLLEFAESYFWGDSGAGINNSIQKQYYYQEKIEVLRNLIEHGPDYLENYQKMIESIRTYIEKESKSSTWDRWDNDYVIRKMIKWIRQWKTMHLS